MLTILSSTSLNRNISKWCARKHSGPDGPADLEGKYRFVRQGRGIAKEQEV
ncbi:hypothetical protein SERLA73DRAFT_145368, partial [Serpula lacrymans var. lacrymans S7.3]